MSPRQILRTGLTVSLRNDDVGSPPLLECYKRGEERMMNVVRDWEWHMLELVL